MAPGKHPPSVLRRGRLLPRLVMASLVVPAFAWYLGSGEVKMRWHQYGLDTAIRRLFRPGWIQGVAMPVLEDLVNEAQFMFPRVRTWSTRGWSLLPLWDLL